MSPSLLPGSTEVETWQAWLSMQLGASMRLVWTDNRSSMLSIRGNTATGYQLRLHHMFRLAPQGVWEALVAYMRAPDAAARRTLRSYINHQQHLIRRPASPSRPGSLRPQGRYFDLETIYHDLNHAYFAQRVQARITWGRRPSRCQRVSIRLGAYCARRRLIRIHCLLDQAFVPRYVVENVVFHEMLHQLIPRQRVNGRWRLHSPAFRAQERRFPAYVQAVAWQRRHLACLLRG